MNKPSENPDVFNRPLTMAKQFAQTSDNKKAARFYRLAGERAFARYENDHALSCFQQALALTSDAQVENRFNLMMAIERVYSLSSDPKARSDNLTSLAALADAIDDDQKRADVAARLALYKLDAGENEYVISVARLAARIAKIAGALAAEVALYLVWGRAHIRLGEHEVARGRLNKALTMARTHVLLPEQADSLRFLGVVHEENGRYNTAQSHYKQALAIYETLQDKRGRGHTLNNLGKVAYDRGEYTAALRYWDQAKRNYLAIGDKPGTCRLLINQSAICMDTGNYPQAEQYNLEAQSLSQEIGLRFGECLAQINLALVHHYLGKHETALEFGHRALSLATKMGSKRLEGYAHNTLGKLLLAQDQLTKAADHYWQAFAIWHEMEQDSLRIEAEAGLAQIALNSGEKAQAKMHGDSILKALQNGQSLDGTESPLSIYWTSYHVLAAHQDNRALKLLKDGHQLLQERAQKIADKKARKMYLEQVEVHNLIVNQVANLL